MYSMYNNFLVINVCNRGKTLCSPCSVDWHREIYFTTPILLQEVLSSGREVLSGH